MKIDIYHFDGMTHCTTLYLLTDVRRKGSTKHEVWQCPGWKGSKGDQSCSIRDIRERGHVEKKQRKVEAWGKLVFDKQRSSLLVFLMYDFLVVILLYYAILSPVFFCLLRIQYLSYLTLKDATAFKSFLFKYF